ncbi:hypothetical protein D9M71_536020 [compost metagenome]
MVNVDRPAIQAPAQLGRQHLHVARKNHQLGAGFLDHLQYLALLPRLVLGVEGEVVVGNLVPLRQGLEIGVVGHHRDHVHGQLADTLAIQQVVQAVVGLGHHDHHLGAVVGCGQLEGHAERIAALGKAGTEAGFVEIVRLAELHANEETP